MNTVVAVASWGPDRLDIFGIGMDSCMYWKSFDATHGWQPAFPVWMRVGAGNETFCSTPSVVSRGPYLLDLFALRKSDRVMMHNQFANNQWSGWTQLDGTVFASAPAAVAAGPGNMAVFGVDDAGGLWCDQWFGTTGLGSGWGGQQQISSPGLLFIGQPSAVVSSQDYHVFALELGLNIYHNSVGVSAGGSNLTWGSWQSVPASFDSSPVAVSSGPGAVHVFAMGGDNAIWHSSLVNGALAGWSSLSGVLNSAPAAVALAADRIDLFALGADNSMQHCVFKPGAPPPGWTSRGGFFNCPPAAVSWGPNRLDVVALGTLNEIDHLGSKDATLWPSLWDDLGGTFQIPRIKPVPAPSGGLASRSNYFFQNRFCKPLLGLRVIIDITEDMVISADSAPLPGGADLAGCSFQLNCFSPGKSTVVAQQYVINLWGKKLQGGIQNWTAAGLNNGPLIDLSCDLMPVPSQQLHKGLRFTISLHTDSNENVTSATFGVFDGGQQLALKSIAVPAEHVTSIVGCELNIVGPANAERATLSSGAGTITYSTVGGQMFAGSALPPCAEESLQTEEQANTTYSTLDSTQDSTFLQFFGHG